MEEVNLRGIHTGRTRGDDDVSLGNSTNSSGSRDDERFNLRLQLEDGIGVEDITDFVLQVGNEALELRLGGTEFSEPVVLFTFGQGVRLEVDGFSDDGILSDNQNVVGTKGLSDLLNLEGTDIFQGNEGDLIVVGK